MPATNVVGGVHKNEPEFWIDAISCRQHLLPSLFLGWASQISQGRGEWKVYVRAIVAMVLRCVGSPCRKSKVIVSTVPVDGAQVMFIDVPAVIEVRVVNVKGFCAEVRAASVAIATEAYVEKCIFGVFPSFSSLLNPSLQLSRMQVLKIDTQNYIVYEEQIIYTDASEEKTRERAKPDQRSSPREERLFMRPSNSFSTPHGFSPSG